LRKEYAPPSGSYIRQLFDDFSIGGWDGEYPGDTLEDILRTKNKVGEYIALIERHETEIRALTAEVDPHKPGREALLSPLSQCGKNQRIPPLLSRLGRVRRTICGWRR
jgi:hypothetical protein